MFALIKDAERLGLKTFGKETFSIETGALGKSIFTTKNSEDQSLSIPPEHMPLLVTFDDISDPISVRKVDPNDLVTSFGEGYSLKSITLEITNDSVTTDEVDKVLGWLNSIANTQLDGDRYRSANAQNQLANSLNILDFVRN